MLFILKQSSKVRNRDDVDTHVSAEIPDPVRYPTLHQCVLDFNIHGPCSTNFCIENGKCKRDFPKPLREETDIMNDTYPSYMRRNRFPVNRGTATTTTDEYIVPYSPYLTAKYRAHINVEICASIKSVKYIYKYIFKGFDAATVEIVDGDRVAHVDEIKAFLEARYVAAPEACWRIFEFPLHESSHSVIRLPVHLENEHIVVYPENEVPNDSQLDGRLRNSMLTAYFDLNRNSTEPLPYTYLEIPYHFRWDSATCSWLKRQRNHKLISRIYAVSPRDKELYSVRIMLLQRTGLKSFEQLRSGPDGVVHESFWDAAVSHGLLEDATEWTTCLRNAATVLMPKSLRLLFATICSHCNPPSCADLWSLFRDDISEDFLRENSVEIAYQLALRDIKEMIDSESSSHFSSLRLPYNPGLLASYSVSDRDHENDYAKSVSFVEEHLPSLNDDQRRIYETVMLSIMQEASVRDHLIFIDGPGGSGKTYLYNILIHSSIVRRKPLLAVSWTGIAATLMHGGEISHTTFKLPLHIFENTSIRAEPGTKLWNRIFNCQLLLWDEITLVPKHAFLAVDRLFRKIRNRENIPFGGVTVVCGGDWRQCLPIIRHAHRCAIIENTIKSCELWPRFKQFRLMTNMWVSDDSFSGFPSFATWLLALGNGTLGDTVVFPDAFFCSEQALIEFIFGDFIQYMNPADVATRSILCPTVNETMHINMKVLSMMPIPLQTFYSTDSLEDPTGTNATLFPLEFIHSLMPSGFPPHRLEIKPGSIVILLRNLNLKYRLTNGTRLIVRRLLPGLIEASVIQSSFVSELSVFLPRIEFISSEADIGVQFRRKQFPVRLGFAMTVNKSQGQTLSHVGLFMTEQLFSHGQLYVALSRARSSSNIRICNLSTPMNELRNIVYNEVITL